MKNRHDENGAMLKNHIADFYSKESKNYTVKRYEGPLQSYPQYIFRKRRSIVEKIIQKILTHDVRGGAISIFDIGCADGSVIQYFDEVTHKKFARIDAIDISEGMIRQARETITDPRYNFLIRGAENSTKQYSIVTELGVYTPDITSELTYMLNKIEKGGYIIYGVALRNSIEARIRRKREPQADFLDTYPTFGQIKKACDSLGLHIELYTPYGIFIPKLWAFPSIARTIQPIIDTLIRYIPLSTNLFHEVVFVLKKKP